jgi:hypothetical protein
VRIPSLAEVQQDTFEKERATGVAIFNSDGDWLSEFREWREGSIYVSVRTPNMDGLVAILTDALSRAKRLQAEVNPLARRIPKDDNSVVPAAVVV